MDTNTANSSYYKLELQGWSQIQVLWLAEILCLSTFSFCVGIFHSFSGLMKYSPAKETSCVLPRLIQHSLVLVIISRVQSMTWLISTWLKNPRQDLFWWCITAICKILWHFAILQHLCEAGAVEWADFLCYSTTPNNCCLMIQKLLR